MGLCMCFDVGWFFLESLPDVGECRWKVDYEGAAEEWSRRVCSHV